MAPTFYHYLPMHMVDQRKEARPDGCRWLGVAAGVLGLLAVGLSIALGILIAQVNSEACQDGLRAERECRNVTHLLQGQLTRAQDSLLTVETEAAICNRTVETLQASLDKKTSENRKQQAHIQELQGEIMTLNQALQNALAKLEQLRKEEGGKSSQAPSASASSMAAPGFLIPAMLLLLLGLCAGRSLR